MHYDIGFYAPHSPCCFICTTLIRRSSVDNIFSPSCLFHVALKNVGTLLLLALPYLEVANMWEDTLRMCIIGQYDTMHPTF